MQFTNPKFLWALLAIVIPIIIHLFQLRKYKSIYFPNVDLLKKLNIEQRKMSNLRRIIILCLRILAITALVFIFAGPYIPNKNAISSKNANIINIYIDNSPSMEGKKESTTLLDDAKNKAKQIIYFYNENNIYRIFNNNSPINPPILNKDDAITAVNNISTSFKKKKMSAIISGFNIQPILSNVKTTNYYISDLQKSTTDIENINLVSDPLFIIPLSNNMSDNINLANIYFDSPVNTTSDLHKININIKNESAVDYEKIPINLHINNKLIATSTVDINASNSQTIQLYFSDDIPGIKHGLVEIVNYPITFDNKYFFTYKIKENIRVIDINNGDVNKYVNTLFSGDSIFYFIQTNYNTIKYDIISSFDLIILDNLSSIPGGIANEIINNLNSGKSCLIIPSDNIDLESYNDFLTKINFGKMEQMINNEDKNVLFSFQSPFFNSVFTEIPDLTKDNIELPVINKYYPIELSTQTLPLIKLTDNKSSILSYSSINKGNLFLINTLLNNNYCNLQLNALFVPIMYKIAFSGNNVNTINYFPTQNIIPLSSNINNLDNLSLTYSEDSTFRDYSFENINGTDYVQLGIQSEILAGNYSIIENSKIIDGFSINNDREESSLDFYNEKEISQIISDKDFENISLIASSNNDFEKSISAAVSNTELWKIFLLLAILFLICEMVLLRIWRNAI